MKFKYLGLSESVPWIAQTVGNLALYGSYVFESMIWLGHYGYKKILFPQSLWRSIMVQVEYWIGPYVFQTYNADGVERKA